MDTMKCGKIDIKLPFIAREMCEDAIILADDLRGSVSDSEFQEFRSNFMLGYMKLTQEVISKGVPSLDFDPLQISTYSVDKIENETLLDPLFSQYGESIEFMTSLKDSASEEHDLPSATLILHYIECIQQLESRVFGKKPFDYVALMAEISPYISTLHKLIVAHNSMPTQAHALANSIKRKRGAKKGGEAKAKRVEELKALVLLEAKTRHSNSNAASAAQAIYEKLNEQGSWLNDANGTPILKDPTTRFTAWIRENRKKLH